MVGILRGFSLAQLPRILEAVRRGGLANIEVTMNSEGAEEQICLARREAGASMNVGAGTVCSTAELDAALEAGAEFIVTPVLLPDVVERCKQASIPVFPGAFTPTEIHQAWQLGADLVKVFPANRLGPSYLRDVLAPLPRVRLMPTGGVTVETLGDYLRAGAVACGVGSPLVSRARVEAEDWLWIEEQTRRFATAYRAH